MTNPQNSSSSNNQFTLISVFNFFPPEIWTQILAKLPAKSLLKFRCVCKSWCAIIDDPYFIHFVIQLSQNPNFGNNNKSLLVLDCLVYREYRGTGCLLIVRHAETFEETARIFKKADLYSYRRIGSCNGLFLVSRNDGYLLYHKELRLWNPSIRKSLVIPACPFPSSLLNDCVYVFGYAPVIKDYKVVAIALEKNVGEKPRIMYVAVYTLRDQQWTVRNDGLNISFPNTIDMFQPFYSVSAAVFLNGMAYWLGNINKDRFQFTHLGSFDFDTEEIAFSELPSSWEEERGSCRLLFLFGESLAIFRISDVVSSIWVLEQDKKRKTWTLWFSGQSSLDGYNLFKKYDGSKEKVFFCESDGGYFICRNESYNIASCEVQEFEGFISRYLQLEMYAESLVLSKGYGARDLRFFP
ncbi:F-box/kelch-repeat protein At3g06240-like [Silene latifolia]|uniref:F-box/kelch-repeat protein At3g06240-like n=1 Tax=Silene latifolia TaxID=37657 RepID=UPI003D771AA7